MSYPPEVEGRALIPRHMNLRILIVEDDAIFLSVLNQKLSAIWKEFPDAEITMVRTLWRALDIAKRSPAPDIILLDLSLLDANPTETAAKIHELQNRSSVVIVTGHSIEELKKLSLGDDVEILVKDSEIWKGARIIEAMLRSLKKKNEPATSEIYGILEKIRIKLDVPQQST